MQADWRGGLSVELIIDPAGSPADVPGFRVGHAEHPDHPTGTTVILCPAGAVGGLDVRGSAPGTRQMHGLMPWHMVQRVHGVLFTGGSSFGLAAVDGAMAWLEERGIGWPMGPMTLPSLPGAVIFDLPFTGGQGRPGPALGRAACEAAADGPMLRGNVGAGTGASVGKLYGITQATKGGLGAASLTAGELKMGCLAVVNAFGDVQDDQGRIIAGARTAPDSGRFVGTASWLLAGRPRPMKPFTVDNTTLVAVVTNASLDKISAAKLAAQTHDGLARVINPVHTSVDGDLVCVLAAGEVEAELDGLGVMACHLASLAILDAVRAAVSSGGLPAARDLEPQFIPL